MNQRWKFFVALIFIGTLLPLGSAQAAPAAAVSSADAAVSAKNKKKRKVQVSIANVNQKRLIRNRFIKLKVRSAKKGKIRIVAKSATFDSRDNYKRFTKVVKRNFRKAGQLRTVKVPLRASGVAAVASCEDRDIKAQAGQIRSRVLSMVRQSDCAPQPVDLSRASRCDFTVDQSGTVCMSPFPSNFYTRGDSESETGRRINFHTDAMPKNKDGIPIDAAPYNLSDGFSQGQAIVLRVPGLDNPEALAQTGAVGLSDPGRYLDADAPVIVLNAQTGKRHPIWVEIDSNASTPASSNLMIHPMVNFDAKGRYIVVLRNLKDNAGNVLSAPAGFRYYRDVLPSKKIAINQRRSYFEDLFRRLRNKGINRSDLYLTWDFTVASDENNTSRALMMRDKAFGELGDTDLADRQIPAASIAPDFTVDSVIDNPNAEVVRRVKGHFEVPCYLTNPGKPEPCGAGATMNLSAAGVPVKSGTWDANFECIVPHSVVDAPGAEAGRALVYGHGLMGSIGGEINARAQRDLADKHGFVVCGTDEIGMSTGDIASVVDALTEMSNFPKVADRLQQGLLNELYLARLMVHPDGLISAPEFRVDPFNMGSDPVISTGSGRAFYRGNSQGGIMGGALTALAPDFDRASLGVSAMNYSVLLRRSSAWGTYSAFFNPSYPEEVARPTVLGLVQMLWDRGEPNGYAHRMTDNPLPNTPAHKVLMDISFGDHLVTNWQSNVMARTIGARAVNPFVYSGRWPGVNGQWGIDPITDYPHNGSAIAYWDTGPVRTDPGNPGSFLGTAAPPVQNIAPFFGLDPHEDTRLTNTAQQMVSGFLDINGRVINPCLPGACYAGGFSGP
ncbi:MAG: hypothetical protein WBW62_08655 [Solirubrobacterales bacterium]